jgi:hypothetical protein
VENTDNGVEFIVMLRKRKLDTTTDSLL